MRFLEHLVYFLRVVCYEAFYEGLINANYNVSIFISRIAKISHFVENGYHLVVAIVLHN